MFLVNFIEKEEVFPDRLVLAWFSVSRLIRRWHVAEYSYVSSCTVASLTRIYYAYEFSIFGPNTIEDWMRCKYARCTTLKAQQLTFP
jgi:hypothetical protein